MKRFLRSFKYGEKGFTLIELLVVVAILGILAAVVIPNVAKFMGSGKVESANTEAHDVQTAVIAYMVDQSLSTWNLDVGPATANGPEQFVLNKGNLQATYTFANGEITGATPRTDVTSKWNGLTYTAGTGWHKT